MCVEAVSLLFREQFYELLYGGCQSLCVLASGSGEVRLSASSSLYEFGCLSYGLSDVYTPFHEAVGGGGGKHGLAFVYRAYHYEAVLYLGP